MEEQMTDKLILEGTLFLHPSFLFDGAYTVDVYNPENRGIRSVNQQIQSFAKDLYPVGKDDKNLASSKYYRITVEEIIQ
jgi:hypothetical protein